jgi:hypothetical protein
VREARDREAVMALFRQRWTAHEADEWTREDGWACVFSSLAYLCLLLSVALLFLRPLWGVVAAAGAALFTWLMHRAIDAKLRTLSEDYETRQKEYLRRLDQVMKWEER